MLRAVPLSPLFRLNNIPIVVGHRGYFTEIENSLRAFRTAIQKKLHMIELDIWLSKDGIPVVIHCNSETECISSTAKGIGKVKDFNSDELTKISLGDDETIPTLEETFKVCKDNIFIIIEIKEKEKKNEIVEACLNLINKYEISDQVLFSSFDHEYYDIIRKSSGIEFKFLVDGIPEFKELLERPSEISINTSVSCNHTLLDEESVKKFHDKGQPVSIYLYPDNSVTRDKIDLLMRIGVDHLIVDDPLLAIKYMSENLNTKV